MIQDNARQGLAGENNQTGFLQNIGFSAAKIEPDEFGTDHVHQLHARYCRQFARSGIVSAVCAGHVYCLQWQQRLRPVREGLLRAVVGPYRVWSLH